MKDARRPWRPKLIAWVGFLAAVATISGFSLKEIVAGSSSSSSSTPSSVTGGTPSSGAPSSTTRSSPIARTTFLDALTSSAGTPPDKEGRAVANGRPFDHALTYASSYSPIKTSWPLGGGYRHFAAVVAIGNCQLSCPDNTTLFEVVIDGHTVISQSVADGQDLPVSASFTGGQVITLSMSFVKSFPGEETWYWGDPKLSP